MLDKIKALENRISELEGMFQDLGEDVTSVFQSEHRKRARPKYQFETMWGMFTALCVATIDPWKQNRVRFFSPLFHSPNLPVNSMPWADAISSAGGFDDCGMNWVPPAGSTLCIVFENGNRESPYYIGTTWHRDRGPDGQHTFGYNIDEYYKIHEGHRLGYLVGPNDGSQVFPQWNTESGNGFDIDSLADFENNPDAINQATYPHIYGWKTPQKHMWKNVDGDYNCNFRGKRMEFLTPTGIHMLLKDDWLHNAQTFCNPQCGMSGEALSCVDEDGNPTEITTCDGETSNSSILGGHPGTPDGTKYGLNSNVGNNPYFKHQNECRPYQGVGTPQNNKVMLPQSGFQILTRSGQTFFFDDSVEEPRGIPNWESSLQPFDFGCNNKFLGKIKFISATGHEFEMSDVEEDTNLRGDQNYMRMKTASGILVELNDHTTGSGDAENCPPNLAGEKRGFTVVTTSNHHFMMHDEGNQQCSPNRTSTGDVEYDRDGSYNTANAKYAFIRIRSGYGLEFLMRDDNSQEKTQGQYIQIFSPQKDNTLRGPHILRFQEQASEPGMVFLRVGGNYICSTYDNHYTVIGDQENNPSNKITIVSKNTLIDTQQFYFNVADIHAFMANEVILLMAGKDCSPETPGPCVPCVYPVLCLGPKGITISDRVFVSASGLADCASIMHLMPFHECKPIGDC